jgi:hypothetical protein
LPPPNPPPKPAVQTPLTGSVTVMLVAVTDPLESVAPRAVAHRPTVAAADVAACSLVILVVASSVTVLLVVAAVVEPEPKSAEAMTIVEPDTETTDPEATEPVRVVPPPAAPEGGVPPPVGAPLGRVPPLAAPLGRAPVPPPKPVVHELFTAWVTVAVVAVNEVAVVEPVVDVAVTHSPAVIELAAPATCWVNVVEADQLTAIWPFCWLCTCIVVPDRAAMVPEAAAPPPPDRAPAAEDAAAVGDPDWLADAELEEPPPQAVSVMTAAMPAAATATLRATRRLIETLAEQIRRVNMMCLSLVEKKGATGAALLAAEGVDG